MALNIPVFRTRALSALIFVAVMLAGLLYNHWSFLVLFTIIHFGCWHEYLRLIEKIEGVFLSLYIRLGLMLMGFGLMLSFCGRAYQIGGYGLKENFFLPVSLAGFLLLVIGILQKKASISPKVLGLACLGWLYISLSWGMMLGLRQEGMAFKGDLLFVDLGIIYPLTLIAAIWINDTLAYLVGSFIGKTPFSKISPKKTWEGTAGGAILCVLTVGLYFYLRVNHPYEGFIIAGIAAVVGTAGDLLESKIKRLAGVKDSGAMLPGHGGFMDRFDSLLLATPFVWIVVKLFF